MKRLLILAPLVLSACASEAIGPSLAKRPVENGTMDEPAREAAPPPAAADAPLRDRIAELVNRSQQGQRAFAELLPRARDAASSAGGEGSESWVIAQQLLSALESARAPSTQALGELDALIAERINGGDEAGLAELQAADAQVAAIVDAQQAEMDRLRERLSR
jgi:hypothetical protein